MDRQHLSVLSVQELSAVFVAAIEEAAPLLLTSDLAGIERQLQEVMRAVLGHVVEVIGAQIVATQSTVPPLCPTCVKPARLVDLRRERHLQGLVGEYTLRRPYFACPDCHQGIVPVDIRLGVGRGALSPGLARVVARLGLEDAFGEARDVLAEALGVDVPKEAVRRITEGIGAVAEAEQQATMVAARQGAIPPVDGDAGQPGILAVEVDGIMVQTDDAWHEAKVGTVAPLGPETERDPDTGRERLCWGRASACVGIEEAEDFWFRVYVDACRRGLGTPGVQTVVVLADGAEWIWKAAPRFLGIEEVEVVEIVDVYHASEHLWTVANAVFGAGTPQASAWAEPLKRRLIADGVLPVLSALRALEVTDPLAAEEVRKARGYFTTHAARMDYPAFVARRLPIGSGAVESAGKRLVAEREKGAGMRWTRAGAQAVATLRALHRSGRWQEFWQTRPQCRRPAVFPRPPRPDPTDAEASAAAA